MYCSDRNSGKTRVNKFFSNGKNLKSDKRNSIDKRKSIDKLKDLQNELFSEGYTLDDYQEEVQENNS